MPIIYFVIFLERLDYFFNIYPFKETISNLYKINEIVKNKELLLIICLNPDSLSKEKIIALKEEFYKYPSHKTEEIIIDKDLYAILDFINSRNIGNIIVTYKDIGEKFSISKMTVTKKIDKLMYLELIISSKTGRSKILYLTKKGKNLIESKSKYG
jgi:DNA-binding MarR family transcriptional regulator